MAIDKSEAFKSRVLIGCVALLGSIPINRVLVALGDFDATTSSYLLCFGAWVGSFVFVYVLGGLLFWIFQRLPVPQAEIERLELARERLDALKFTTKTFVLLGRTSDTNFPGAMCCILGKREGSINVAIPGGSLNDVKRQMLEVSEKHGSNAACIFFTDDDIGHRYLNWPDHGWVLDTTKVRGLSVLAALSSRAVEIERVHTDHALGRPVTGMQALSAAS